MADKKCVSCEYIVATIRATDGKWYCNFCYADKFKSVDKYFGFLLTLKKLVIKRDIVQLKHDDITFVFKEFQLDTWVVVLDNIKNGKHVQEWAWQSYL